MTATTLDSVEVNTSEWTQLSSAEVHTLQAITRTVGVIFSDTQPAASVKVGVRGHVLCVGDYLATSTGGTSWGRSKGLMSTALVALTEG